MNHLEKINDFFQTEPLKAKGKALSEKYRTAQPFPHIVIDDFFPPEILDEVLEAVESPDSRWHHFDNDREIKRQLCDDTKMDPRIQIFLYKLNSPPMLDFLESLTGITGLVSDPFLAGGGVHQLPPGGFLKIHADFNFHNRLKLDRRINVLVYLNKNWREEYAGHLQLWDEPMEKCVQNVLPVFNRMVVFNTTSTSWHGNPEPLKCPEGWSRKSVAMYYYTNGRPDEERHDSHGTLFRRTPGDAFAEGELQAPRSMGVKAILKSLTPPIVLEAGKRVLGR
ncbi:MAG: 2OG-Fe(II) oxygenase [Pirellulales bacterium]